MTVILEVISYKGVPPVSPKSVRFDESGGSIGRSFDNHLALPDDEKVISRHHGDIRFENGVYVYCDASTGGTLLCNENRLLGHGDSVALADGDLLKVGEYELQVKIEQEAQPFPVLFTGLGEPQGFGNHAAENAFDINISSIFNDREPPPSVLAQDASNLRPEFQGSYMDQPDAAPFQQNFTPPGIQSIPEDFSFDSSLRDGPVLPPAAFPKTDSFEFPDDWFGDLGREPGGSEGNQTPAPAYPSTPLEPPQADIFPESQFSAGIGNGTPNRLDALEPKPLVLEKGKDEPAPFSGEMGQFDHNLLFDDDEHPSAQVESGVKDLEAGSEAFSEASSPVIDLPKPVRPTPPSRVTPAVLSAQAEPAPPVVQPQPPSPASDTARVDMFQCFLEGAGFAEFPKMTVEEQAGAMKALGEVYRGMVEGMMMILRARTEEKGEIRADRTTINREKNNPLKFLPLAEDAMKIMISRKHPSYIDATLAVREGFADIMKHQMAMRAGMQAAVGEILKRFEPSGFEKRFDEGIVFQKKTKCWDAYSNAYPSLVVEAMDNLLGDTFGKAYEDQMRMLRDSRDKR